PRAGDLAQIIELASGSERNTPAAKWMMTSLHPVELDQALAIGARLRERAAAASGAHFAAERARAAHDWLLATERGAARIWLVVGGGLSAGVRAIEYDSPGESPRVTELVWASLTEDVLAVRARVEGWSGGELRPSREKRARTAPIA